MKKIVGWLMDAEEGARSFYEHAAMRFNNDPDLYALLKKLEGDEREHHDMVCSAADILKGKDGTTAIILIDKEARQIEHYMAVCRKALDAGELTKDELVDIVISLEYSELNGIFLYAMNALKCHPGEYDRAQGLLKNHTGAIEHFIAARPEYSRFLEKISKIPKIADKNILVVDEDREIVDVFNIFLSEIGRVDSAVNADEALAMLKSKPYSAVVVEVNMKGMNGLEMYQVAKELYPELACKFIFLADYTCAQYLPYIRKNGLKHLDKPASIKDIERLVQEIING